MREPKRLGRDARGATSIEYGLICALIFLAIIGGVSRLGGGLTNMLYNVATRAGAQM